jgi:hypothetical protein
MPTTYTIHLRNEQQKNRRFWCFLNTPESNISAEVFANSSAYLFVPPTSPGQDDTFTIPLQYVIQAGASNNAVGLKTKITSKNVQNTDLNQAWDIQYYVQNQGPLLTSDGSIQDPIIELNVLPFDKSKEEPNRWYSNLTYGVKSENGFMGITWSPDPNDVYRIKPKVQFYVTIGDYESNTLAEMTAISKDAASITADSFDVRNECTVVLKSDGTWMVVRGNLNATPDLLQQLMESHLTLSRAHAELVNAVSAQTGHSFHRAFGQDRFNTAAGLSIARKLYDDRDTPPLNG